MKYLRVISLLGVVLALSLFYVGADVTHPGSYLSSGSVVAYVGGDAYNYIMEASLRGGEIAGAVAKRALYICSGWIVLFFSALSFGLSFALAELLPAKASAKILAPAAPDAAPFISTDSAEE